MYLPRSIEKFKIRDKVYEAYNRNDYLEEPKGTYIWRIW